MDMTYRRLGRSGLKVSALSLGGWTTFGESVVDQPLVDAILGEAFERGVNFYDIADVYAKGESERAMGRSLSRFPRHRLVVSSKVFWPMSEDVNDRGLSRKHVVESCERSLKRLGMDYLDLYYCHRFDPETPLEETVRAMDDLIRQGKILHWGTSEWTGDQIRRAHEVARLRNADGPVVEQPQYNLLSRLRIVEDVGPACADTGMGMTTFSPLAVGLFTGKYENGVPEGSRLSRIDWLAKTALTEEKLSRSAAANALARSWGLKPSHAALAWVREQPGVSSVILGATSVAQLRENLDSLEVTLTPAQRQELEAACPPTR
jgi:voltage-dependent potassium channel beta subunit